MVKMSSDLTFVDEIKHRLDKHGGILDVGGASVVGKWGWWV